MCTSRSCNRRSFFSTRLKNSRKFGGSIGRSVLSRKDFQKAVQLDAKSVDGYLWLGIAERKAGHNAEARKALQTAMTLNPARAWIKQQLAKTP